MESYGGRRDLGGDAAVEQGTRVGVGTEEPTSEKEKPPTLFREIRGARDLRLIFYFGYIVSFSGIEVKGDR